MTTDELYMRRCLQLARNGIATTRPNPMVGAVIVVPGAGEGAEGRIIGEGYHVRSGEGHAEVNAFASVSKTDEMLLRQATVYVSLEPCSHYGKTPPCADLIIRKGVKRVVVGCQDDFAEVQGRGIKKLREAGIEVTTGVLEDECRWINRRFFTYHREHRPWIILKWAQSADGFIDCHFKPCPFSTPYTKMLVHKLRAEADAIVIGRVTDEREHPQLNVRHWWGKSPKRIVIAGQAPDVEGWWKAGLQSVIVEGGRATLQWFIDNDLWDELRIERAPIATGGGTMAPTLPKEMLPTGEAIYDGNIISTYLRPKSAGISPHAFVSHTITGLR